MLANHEMTANRFGKLARGRRIIRLCNEAWEQGKTVYVSTYTNVTKIAPKHRDLVKLSKTGSVLIQRGKRFDCADFCKFTVSA